MEHIRTEGTFINAKSFPRKGIKHPDYKRVYYCTTVRNPSEEFIAFFERKFIAPANPK